VLKGEGEKTLGFDLTAPLTSIQKKRGGKKKKSSAKKNDHKRELVKSGSSQNKGRKEKGNKKGL